MGEGSGRGSGWVRLFLSAIAGRVRSTFRWVGFKKSDPRTTLADKGLLLYYITNSIKGYIHNYITNSNLLNSYFLYIAYRPYLNFIISA